MATRILLADDHRVMRQGLKSLIETIPGMEVVGEADTGAEAVKMASRLLPDLALMDVTMPDLNGVEATRRILRECRGVTRVIGLSMQTDRHYVLGMLKAGASAYLLKSCSFDELKEAISKVQSGGTYLAPIVADLVVNELQGGNREEDSAVSQLTSREREILQLIAEAKKSREIADMLNISLKTVYTHRRNIMEKLDAKNLADLTRYAIKEGLTSLSH